MSKRQILALFVCNLVLWTAGNGLIPLLPVVATRLGASPAVAGYYLAFSYLALALGAVTAGWLSDRLQRRKMPFIIVGLASIPIAWLIGRVANVWGLSVLTAMLWFCAGLDLALVSILAGLSAREGERGKVFGLLSLTSGLGGAIGGLASGSIVERWGFPTMFLAVAVFLILLPLAGAFLTEQAVVRVPGVDAQARKGPGLGRYYYLLFAASVAASVAHFIILFGRSLLMGNLGFGPVAIASTGVVGGIVSMPLPLLMGWLSDRAGRKGFLYLGYLAGIIGLSILAMSESLWHFWIVLALEEICTAANISIGSAWVTDLVSRESLGKGLSLFGATSWLGGVLGFATAGYAFQSFGRAPTLLLGICLKLMAVVLLLPIRSALQRKRAISH